MKALELYNAKIISSRQGLEARVSAGGNQRWEINVQYFPSGFSFF